MMKKFKDFICFKSIVLALIVMLLSITSVYAIENEGTLDFKELVEQTEYYKKYETSIDSLYVNTKTEDNIYTVAYLLEENDKYTKTLVFVGDEEFNLTQVLIVESSDTNASTKDLLTGSKIRAHLGYCVKDVCTNSIPFVGVYDNPGCTSVVGQTCLPLALLPGYAKFIYLLCRGGVFVGCRVDTKRYCTAWSHYEYECSIP
ncbi:MAG: hypothetical protein KHZ15_08185 [Coprobacillus cateniformis]|nr:hypothetical protein [Coprobacillus cateniformis]